MRKKRPWFILITITIFLVACNNVESENDQYITELEQNAENIEEMQHQPATVATVGDNLPISRATVAKMIALAFNDINTIQSLDIEHNFEDIDVNMWYASFVNAVYVMGIMNGYSNIFNPDSPLTLSDAERLINVMDPDTPLSLGVTDENRNMPISYALWNQLYLTVLNNLSDNNIQGQFGIVERLLIVLATDANNALLPQGTIITDNGPFTSQGIVNDAFLDTQIKALEKGGEIVSILSIEDTSPIVRNAFIVRNTSTDVTIFAGGVERTYVHNNPLYNSNMSNRVGNVQIRNGEALAINLLDETITSPRIERVHWNYIELYQMGRMELSTDFRVYSIADGEVRWRVPRHLIVGSNIANFMLDGEIIEAAVINDTATFENIRVAIGTTGFNSLIHSEVVISATADFTIRGATGERRHTAGEAVTFRVQEDLLGGYRVHIETEASGRIQISSVGRGWPGGASPTYRGIIEIGWENPGFTIINEVPVSHYLYAVVPSEMPSAYGVDASKIQAVTARSFAHNQFFENRFHRYGANVDDSVMSQVYNNIPENDVSIQAVDATENMYLTFNGNVITANFFSTSSGVTANQGEVWSGGRSIFPTDSQPFLQSVRHYHDADFGDLSIEENARRFLNTRDIDSYCNISPWFRWSTQMSAAQVAASINANLTNRFNSNRFLIKALQDDGVFRSKPVDTIGELVNIEVISRGEAGNITKLQVTGTENTIQILTEFNIRNLIAPNNRVDGAGDIILSRADGSTLSNFAMMPSGFFTMERLTDADGNILHVRFIGGGFGHGVGLSQYGAKGKLLRGYSFVEVLEHFYTGASVEVILP